MAGVASSELRVGDLVNVPGPDNAYGTVRFIGAVDGKAGTFVGVELAPEYAEHGKNSGDVAGKHYFRTQMLGGGIFLPVAKAEKRLSDGSDVSVGTAATEKSARTTTSRAVSGLTSPISTTPAASVTGRKTPARATGMVRPSFSQSVGPGSLQARVGSPTAQLRPTTRRETLGRPPSPLRRTPAVPVTTPSAAGRLHTPKTRSSVALARSTMGTPNARGGLRTPSYAAGTAKFTQSMRTSMTGTTPARRGTTQPAHAPSTPLGPDDRFDEDDTILEQNEPETTPTPVSRVDRSTRNTGDGERYEQDAQRLRQQLEEKDRQLAEQAQSLVDMERSINELQRMLPDDKDGTDDELYLPKDVQTLRTQLKQQHERIKLMNTEFDHNRADFRSTIDALELASTETERVYEQRVDELVEQIRHLQERNDDVESVAQQFKQLEELVAELEEGLEESRRAEAEARAEVEGLTGEVERTQAELTRERERKATQDALEGGSASSTADEVDELHLLLSQRDDEIRGLKAIIQNLQQTDHRRTIVRDAPNTPKANGYSPSKTKSTNTVVSADLYESDAALQRQIQDLETMLQQSREENRHLRDSVRLSGAKWPTALNTALDKHASSGSQRTVVGHQARPVSNGLGTMNSRYPRQDSRILKDEQPGQEREEADDERRRRQAESRKSAGPPSTTESSSTGGPPRCEICEEPGHDILSCASMMSSVHTHGSSSTVGGRNGRDVVTEAFRRSNSGGHLPTGDRPAPLRKSSNTYESPHPPPSAPLPGLPGRTSFAGVDKVGSGGSDRSSATPAASAANTSADTTPAKAATEMEARPRLLEGTGDQAGMLGGKTTGVINPDMWCALCERDGHESVDCPLEDAF